MPQLDPMPWFFILSASWLIFIIFSPAKILKHENLNDPASKKYRGLNISWPWPWL